MNQETLDNYERAFQSFKIKYLVFGYIIDGKGQMEYLTVACVNEAARDRNLNLLVNGYYWELKDENKVFR